MIKKVLKGIVVSCMAVSMLASNISIPVFANDNISDTTTTVTYTNELPGFNGTNVETVSDGYRLANLGHNNNVAVSSVSAKEFIFETDITYLSGEKKTSFIFGAGGSDYTTIGNGKAHSFFGLEIFNDNGTVKFKLFEDGPGSLGDKVIDYTSICTTSDDTVHLKASYTNANGLEVWVDNTKANYTLANPNFTTKYNGGYFGLLTWNTGVEYKNISLKAANNSVYENVLPDYVGTQVSNLSTGYKIGNNGNNNHSVSSVATKEFEFETTASYKSGDRFSLVIGADSNLNNVIGGKFFGLEFKAVNGNEIKTKLFREYPNKVYFEEISLGSIPSNQNVRIKASLVNGTLKAKINDNAEVVLLNDTTSADLMNDYGVGGNVGFLTWQTEVDLENFKITTLGYNEYGNILPNLVGVDVTPLVKGYRLFAGGNNIAISSVSATEFNLTADFTYESGRKTTVLLGAQDDEWSTLGRGKQNTMFGIEFDKNGSLMTLKMFQDGPNSLGDELATGSVTLDSDDNTIRVEISYSVAEGFRIEIDDKVVTFNVPAYVVNAYVGGYIGFLTYNTTSYISNITLEAKKEEASNFITNLTNLNGKSGTWRVIADGLYSSGSGDNFAMSNTVDDNFIYEADIKFHTNDGAAALVFRSNESGSEAYVANILKKDGAARLFKFPEGADVSRATIDTSKDTYHLKVIAVGSILQVYLDDDLIIAGNDSRYSSGRFGLLTWNSTATYQNVNYTPLDTNVLPTLTGLTVAGENVIFSPAFDANTVSYSAFVPAATDKISITVSADSDVSLSYKAIANTTEYENGTITSGQSFEITPTYGASNVVINATKGGFTTSTLIKVTKKADNNVLANQAYRPQLHFSPEINFMNDPNGLVFDTSNNTWHMFFQYSPQVAGMGSQTWGHAVSDDLVNWVELPVAIPITDRGAIFSGSAVCLTAEEAATVPFFTANDIAKAATGEGSLLVALYTTISPQQDQSVAYSTDHGVTWTQHEDYAIKHDYTSDRDPKVFKIPGDDRWYLIVAGGYARLYVSDNLRDWELAQDLRWADGSLVNSECPDMYPLEVLDKNGTPTGVTKWVYNASSEWYIVGDMVWNNTDGVYNFVVEKQVASQTGGSSSGYAAQSYYNDGSGKNRRLTVHWMQDYSAPGYLPDKTWNGIQSFPLETTLKRLDDGSYLICQNPAEEVEKLRVDTPLYSASNLTVKEDDDNILAGIAAQVFEVEAIIDLDETTATQFGFELRTGADEKTVYYYNVSNNTMVLDKSKSSTTGYENEILSAKVTPTADGKVKLRAIVDNSIIEAFGNDGDGHLIDLLMSSPTSVGMSFYTTGGSVKVDELTVYDMKSIYTGKSVRDSVDTVYTSVSAKEFVEVGEVFTVTAAIYPDDANISLDWEYDASALTFVSQDKNSITLIATALGTYEIDAIFDDAFGETVTVNVIEKVFNTNLDNFVATGGSWDISDRGLFGKNAGGSDAFYVSDTYVDKDESFTLVSDMFLENGPGGGLLLGVSDRTNPASHWYCLNSDRNEGNFKFFKNTGGQNWAITPAYGQFADVTKYRLKVTFDAETDTFTVYAAPYGTNDFVELGTRVDTSWTGGYIGVMSYRTDVSFNNTYFYSDGLVEDLIADFEAVDADDYTEKSYEAYEEAVKALEDAYEAGTVNENNIDSYKEAIEQAIDGLVDVTELKELIAELDGISVDGMIDELGNAIDEVMNDAKELLKDGNEDEVDSFVNTLLSDVALTKRLDTLLDDLVALPEASDTETDDDEAVSKLAAALASYEEICEIELEAFVRSDLVANMEELEVVLKDYKVLEGDKTEITADSDKDLRFVVNGAFNKFVGIKVDGKDVAAANYTKEKGSTVVTLKADYIDTLAAGKHTITFIYNDGEVSAEFTVKAKVPTGDSTNVFGLFLMMILSLGVVFNKRKED